MSSGRRAWLWGLVVKRTYGDPVAVAHVAAAAVSAAGVGRAAVTLTLSGTPRETVYAGDPTAAELEELPLTLGDGRGVDAVTGGPALAGGPDKRAVRSALAGIRPRRLDAAAMAVFALPLHVGGIRLGFMDRYRARPGPLHHD